MKKFLISVGVLSLMLAGSVIAATTKTNNEPPQEYINNLKVCKAGTTNRNGSIIEQYTIKGLLPDGRCEVEISEYTNFADPKVYEGFITILKGFSGDNLKESDIPTQAQMIEQAKKEKSTTYCKFTKEQRYALHAAYLKHDNRNKCVTEPNGVTSCTYSTYGMSSYDTLMGNYSIGTCKQN